MQKSLKTLTSILALALALSIGGTSALAFPGAQPSATNPAASPAATPTALKGTVVETKNSGGYTYLLVESGGQKRWAAIPQAEVQVGQQVELRPGMEMQQFTSKTLNHTFASIVFSGGLVAASPAPAAPASGK